MISVVTFNSAAIHEDVHVFVVTMNVGEHDYATRFYLWLVQLLVEVFYQALGIVNSRMQKFTRLLPSAVQIYAKQARA